VDLAAEAMPLHEGLVRHAAVGAVGPDTGAGVGSVGPSPRLVYVTPSTQYPSGVRMTLPRRLALLDYAAATGALIVEDDYDCEFVWRGREIAALQGLRGGTGVLYLGSAAKSLLPGLRLGWIVAPPDLVGPLRAIHRALGLGANVHAQAALASFLETGSYRAHIRRLSQAYAERGRRLSQRLADALGDAATVSEPDGGLQLLVRFRQPIDERALTARLAEAGYAAAGLSGYCLQPAANGIVVGFGDASERHAAAFAALVARLALG
jgi:GntR family transcriptional regulator / MocR family aminotransferase